MSYIPGIKNLYVSGPLASSGGFAPSLSIQLPQVYYHYPVVAGVVENDIVMNATNTGTLQAPLTFKKAVNGDDNYYMQIYGVAKNVSGGFADIWLGSGTVVSGFSFGVFIGVDYYIDPAVPGGLTYNAPATGTTINPIKIGRALDATHLILYPIAQFCQEKAALYTSDGSYDITVSGGTAGQVPVYDSTAVSGIAPKAAVVAAAPFTYTTATRTLTIATATNSVPGVLSAADHTTFAGYAATIALKAPLAAPTFTGDVNSSTGNVLVSTLGKGLQVRTGTNSKIGTAVLSGGTVTVANTSVTANSRIFVTSQTDGGTVGFLRVSAKTNATSFVITSSSILDTSTVAWMIVESIP